MAVWFTTFPAIERAAAEFTNVARCASCELSGIRSNGGRDQVTDASGYVSSVTDALGGHGAAARAEMPAVRPISFEDLREALRKGFEDFTASRSDVIFICLIYPLAGLFLVWLFFGYQLLPLIFPAASGFALIGPVAAVGLYDMSRRREMGEEPSWADAFKLFTSPSFGAILVLGVGMIVLFLFWMVVAQMIYGATLGPEPPASVGQFITDVLFTGAGWAMIIVGCAVGFLFAVGALAISVVSFPLLVDRDVGVPVAVATSIRVALENPVTVLAWGLIVAIGLVLGSIPLFLGLIVVLPVLGHATWHLYRRAVVREDTGPPEPA